MRKPALPVQVTLSLLLLGALAAWGATSLQTASFTPPPVEGNIFAVINADRSAGARTTQISVSWGSARRTVLRANPYGSCAGAIAGWVLMVRHTRPDSVPFTVSTTGTIVRPPYQGTPPPEVGHACYKLEKMRLQ